MMSQQILYPLRFSPIYQYRLWGGRRLAHLLTEPLPDGSVGEAWLLSDRDDHPSLVSDGILKGKTIVQLVKDHEQELMGKFAGLFPRFPLLLKFLDCQQVLSVQVHPSDDKKQLIPKGENGKTEAWLVLETTAESKVYAGLTPDTTPENLKTAIANHKVADHLHSFKPQTGDSILIKAGTVHTLDGVVVFEIQENSDITFRLYDWDRTDEKTGKPRELQIDKALACIDYRQINIGPITVNESLYIKRLILQSDYFLVWRHQNNHDFNVGELNEPRILVCIDGTGNIDCGDTQYFVKKGQVFLLPAVMGICSFKPEYAITLLEIGIPSYKL